MYYGISFSSLPRCGMFGRYRQRHGWEHGGRSIDSDLLIFVISGGASFRYLGSAFQLSAGDWLLIPRGTYYSAHAADFCEYYFFHFDGVSGSLEKKPLTDSGLRRDFSFCPAEKTSETVYLTEKIHSGDDLTELLRISGQMHRLMLRTGTEERLLFDLYFGQLILILAARVSGTVGTDTPPLLGRAIAYIQENYTQPLTLTVLSEHLQVSKSYLLRLFRKHLGMTVTGYVNGIKLDYAAQLLGTSRMNVAQTADYLGYSDSGYFSRLFRKRFGVSPSEFVRNRKGPV